MPQETLWALVLGALVGLLGLVTLFAQARLFSIDKNLKSIRQALEAAQTDDRTSRAVE